jgi:hypothetical protein
LKYKFLHQTELARFLYLSPHHKSISAAIVFTAADCINNYLDDWSRAWEGEESMTEVERVVIDPKKKKSCG